MSSTGTSGQLMAEFSSACSFCFMAYFYLCGKSNLLIIAWKLSFLNHSSDRVIHFTLPFRTEHTITIATTFATVYCAMLALGIPIEGKRLPGRILILTVCLSGKKDFINRITN